MDCIYDAIVQELLISKHVLTQDGDEAKIKEEFNKLFGSKKKSVATGGGVFGKSLSQGMFSANKDEAAPSRNEKKVSMKVPEVGVVRAFSAMSGGLVGAIATAEEEAQRKAILERRLSKISSKSEEEKYPSKRVLLEDPKSGVAQYTRGFTHSLSHEEMGSGGKITNPECRKNRFFLILIFEKQPDSNAICRTKPI